MLSEAALVAAQDSTKISELFLLDEETYWTRVENAPEPAGGLDRVIPGFQPDPAHEPGGGRGASGAPTLSCTAPERSIPPCFRLT